jgi:Aerotolerance regulator N-terminal/von Willebrand factor type A domain
MEFLHWWAIGIGGLSIAAPVVVHFMTKPRPVPFGLSTIRFLNEVIQQRRAKARLRDLLVLLLRTLCIALLAMALARPLFSDRPQVAAEPTRDSQRVLIVDQSHSMQAGSGGVTCWSSAVVSALLYLDSAQGMQAGVVLAGAKARPVFNQMSPNLASLRKAIEQAKPVAERCDTKAAIEEAAKLLEKADGESKELVIISDFQRSNWGTLMLDLVPKGTKIQFHSVALPDRNNVGITAARVSTEPIVGQPVNLEIDVANYSSVESKIKCKIQLAGLARTLEATVPPETTRTLTESLTFDEVGWKHGWVRLISNLDVLPEDDERPVAIRVRPRIQVLLISRQNVREIPSSSFYVQQALDVALLGKAEQSDSTEGKSVVQRVHPDRDPQRNWPNCDVYVLDHPGALSNETLQLVASQLKRGRGLLYIASELVDASNMAQLGDLLGSDFQPPVQLLPPNDNQARKELTVRKVQGRLGPFQVLGSSSPANLLRAVRFQGGLATQANTSGIADEIIAELSDTSALMYVTGVGAGQIAVINADLGKSNWAVQPTFLPVLSELTQALLAGRSQSESASPGEPLVRLLPPTLTSESILKARTIDGLPPLDAEFGKWQWVANQGSVIWNWPEPPGPGVYALEENNAPVWMVTTAAPGTESDLSTLEKDVLTERVSSGRKVGFSTSGDDQRPKDDLWKWLIVACLCGLVGEVVLLRWNRM